jgi:hypothetical protein
MTERTHAGWYQDRRAVHPAINAQQGRGRQLHGLQRFPKTTVESSFGFIPSGWRYSTGGGNTLMTPLPRSPAAPVRVLQVPSARDVLVRAPDDRHGLPHPTSLSPGPTASPFDLNSGRSCYHQPDPPEDVVGKDSMRSSAALQVPASRRLDIGPDGRQVSTGDRPMSSGRADPASAGTNWNKRSALPRRTL